MLLLRDFVWLIALLFVVYWPLCDNFLSFAADCVDAICTEAEEAFGWKLGFLWCFPMPYLLVDWCFYSNTPSVDLLRPSPSSVSGNAL